MYKERIESCGQRIAKALDINGMKQAELCKLAKVPKSSLSLYLSGAYEPKQNRIYDMARVLNVSEAWLMGYDVPMERDKKTPFNELPLTEGEKVWLEKYNTLSEESRTLFIKMLDAFDKINVDSHPMVIEMILAALKNQK